MPCKVDIIKDMKGYYKKKYETIEPMIDINNKQVFIGCSIYWKHLCVDKASILS